MYNFILMAIYNSREYLPDDLSRHFLCENTAVNDLIEKLTALSVPCAQVEIVGVLIILEESHNVRVLQLGKDIIFLILINTLLLL